jgi:hypothetical protein
VLFTKSATLPKFTGTVIVFFLVAIKLFYYALVNTISNSNEK